MSCKYHHIDISVNVKKIFTVGKHNIFIAFVSDTVNFSTLYHYVHMSASACLRFSPNTRVCRLISSGVVRVLSLGCARLLGGCGACSGKFLNFRVSQTAFPTSDAGYQQFECIILRSNQLASFLRLYYVTSLPLPVPSSLSPNLNFTGMA